MAKFITAQEAANLINDGDSIGFAGMGLSGFPGRDFLELALCRKAGGGGLIVKDRKGIPVLSNSFHDTPHETLIQKAASCPFDEVQIHAGRLRAQQDQRILLIAFSLKIEKLRVVS